MGTGSEEIFRVSGGDLEEFLLRHLALPIFLRSVLLGVMVMLLKSRLDYALKSSHGSQFSWRKAKSSQYPPM